MFDHVDLLICGAGPVGCVIAERAANVLGWRVLIVERRPHLAGNCHDSVHSSGLLVHNYGPHYFRTRDDNLVRYLSRFTSWIPGNYIVKSFVKNRLHPFPINLTTLEKFFGKTFDAETAHEFLAAKRVPCETPANSEEVVLDKVGKELYESFYVPYTRKQWGLHPRDLEPSVCGRIPVRLNRDDRYVDHPHQIMPSEGFAAMFGRMAKHPRIRVLLNCDFRELESTVSRRATVYTGPIDGYFNHCYGKLPYRSLDFRFVPFRTPWAQPCVQINYPADFPHTRSVEYKHVTGQVHPETVVAFETPQARGEPYYPVPTSANMALYRRYQERAEIETRKRDVFFCGRLAQYRYFNTDEVILEALRCFERIRKQCALPLETSVLSPSAA